MHIVGPMLATEVVSAQYSDTTKRHPCGIEQVPGLALMLDSHVHALRLLQLIVRLQRYTLVDHLVRYVIYPVSGVWIEWDARILRLNLQWLVNKRISLLPLLLHVNRVVSLFPCEG